MDGASVVSDGPTTRKYRFKTSLLFLSASYVGVFGLITIVVAFSSPYWMSSHKHTYSNFVRQGSYVLILSQRLTFVCPGLWNFCFDHYK